MRLFIGTLLGPANQEFYSSVATAITRRHQRVVRPIPADSAHLTYVFSADTDETCLSQLQRILCDCTARTSAFDIELGEPHVLLMGPRPRLVTANVVGGALECAALAHDLVQRVSGASLPLTTSVAKAPHVTVARFSKHARRREADTVTQTIERSTWTRATRHDRIALVQIIGSRLTSAGPVYDTLAECALR